MLSEAVRLNGVTYILGGALALLFADNTLDLVTLITNQEFVSEPIPVLREALRVAGQGLILGILNRQSVLGWERRREGGRYGKQPASSHQWWCNGGNKR